MRSSVAKLTLHNLRWCLAMKVQSLQQRLLSEKSRHKNQRLNTCIFSWYFSHPIIFFGYRAITFFNAVKNLSFSEAMPIVTLK